MWGSHAAGSSGTLLTWWRLAQSTSAPKGHPSSSIYPRVKLLWQNIDIWAFPGDSEGMLSWAVAQWWVNYTIMFDWTTNCRPVFKSTWNSLKYMPTVVGRAQKYVLFSFHWVYSPSSLKYFNLIKEICLRTKPLLWATVTAFIEVTLLKVMLNTMGLFFLRLKIPREVDQEHVRCLRTSSPAALWGPACVLFPGWQGQLCHRTCSRHGPPNPALRWDHPPSSGSLTHRSSSPVNSM